MQDDNRNGGRIALVTRPPGALGAAIAPALLEQRPRAALLDNDRSAVDALAATLGADVLPRVPDVSDAAQVKAAGGGGGKQRGPVDILVNNAGILSNAKIVEASPEDWRRTLSVNLDGPDLLCPPCVPAMRERRWGRIVT